MEEDAEIESLGDAAYGIFEIFLNRGLKERGRYLFERVESNEDFFADFKSIFLEFERDYGMLADALTESFESVEALYENFRAGEGVIPSKTHRMYWIVQDAPEKTASPAPAGPDEDDKGGKWLVFADAAEADELWRKIRDATAANNLGIWAKVSTAKALPESDDNRVVIYVSTADWSDEKDVMDIREKLRALGVEKRIGYKRNIETYQGEYSEGGKKVTYYSA
ncbi:MAG: DUF1917 domain-containing protein [Methanomicrobium sp.]|nr:DUF1917 domain-containing protein [Methanomicrobium sp.]